MKLARDRGVGHWLSIQKNFLLDPHFTPQKQGYSAPFFFSLDLQFLDYVVYCIMLNEENELTEALLNLVCEGVEVPDEAEENDTVDLQHD